MASNSRLLLVNNRVGEGSSTLSMLQITKASEVVPMSLYLWGIFFQGGQSKSKPNSPDPLSWPDSPSESEAEAEPARWTLSPGRPLTVLLSLTLSFSLMLQKTLNSKLCFGGKRSKRRRPSEGCENELVWWEKRYELSALRVSLAIWVSSKRA